MLIMLISMSISLSSQIVSDTPSNACTLTVNLLIILYCSIAKVPTSIALSLLCYCVTLHYYTHTQLLQLLQLPYWEPPVLQVSSRTGKGVMAVWEAVEQFTSELNSRGQLDARRRSQGRY
jgi:Methylmalonyl Co-A mutase-associated GTPase MeaB